MVQGKDLTPIEKAAFEYCQAREIFKTMQATCANQDAMVHALMTVQDRYEELKALVWVPVGAAPEGEGGAK
jgi:hypothetical protein